MRSVFNELVSYSPWIDESVEYFETGGTLSPSNTHYKLGQRTLFIQILALKLGVAFKEYISPNL